MRSVADGLREAQRERMAALSAAERVAVAFQLGDDDLDMLCAAQRLSPAEARARLKQARCVGRRPSCASPRNDR